MGHRRFVDQLENLGRESASVARFVYAGETIEYRASKSKRLLQRLNETAVFWITVQSALQTSAYISLGRVFGTLGKFNISNLLIAFERDASEFQRPALSKRKWDGTGSKPEWLDEYLDTAYYPTAADVAEIRIGVEKQRKTYERAAEEVRNQYFAHRAEISPDAVNALFGKSKVQEICGLALFLVILHDALNELYLNGRKPEIRPLRTAMRGVLVRQREKRKQRAALEPQEAIAQDVDDLMDALLSVGFDDTKRRKRL